MFRRAITAVSRQSLSRAVATRSTAVSSRTFSSSATSATSTTPAATEFDWKDHFDYLLTPSDPELRKVSDDQKEKLQDLINDLEAETEAYYAPLFGKGRPSVAEVPQQLTQMRSRIEEVERLIRNTADVKPIDFAAYRAKIQDKAAVDALEREYRNIKLPVYKFSTKPFQAHMDHILKRTREQRDMFDQKLEEIRAEVEKLRQEKARLRVVTYQDILDQNPEWRDEILARVEHPDYEVYSFLRSTPNEELTAIKQYKDDDHHHH